MSVKRSASHGLLVGVIAGLVVVALVFALVGALALNHHDHEPAASSDAPATPSSTSGSSPTPMPATDPALARFYDQKLSWNTCSVGKCALLTVPLDYTKPTGTTIRIAVLEVPATGAHPVGDLVINPGGPGQSGVQYAAAASYAFRKPLTEAYNVVGFDPRGVGQSDPLTCWGTASMDHFVASNPAPSTAAGRTAVDQQVHAFGESCLRNSGELARHMSTVEVARDMDILRAALAQPKLDYFGASYGTLIGATYANLFPTHVGRMVLDGALDPALSNLQLNLAQAHGFEVALRSYVGGCISEGNCVLGDTVDAGVKRIQQLLASIGKQPLPTGDSARPLTLGLATLGIFEPLYDKSSWDQLTSSLKEAIEDHSGKELLAAADLYTSRGKHGYVDNSLNALYNVDCLDDDESVPTSQVPSYIPRFEKASPTFGAQFAFSLSTCYSWPIKTHAVPHALHAKGAPPIVVMGTTRDPATPLAWAEGLAKELDSGVLVVRNGDGHTGYNQGNVCADEAVENYLVHDQVPTNGLRC
jgi:pimeloyl-ACP methyl ester carboxylesterase